MGDISQQGASNFKLRKHKESPSAPAKSDFLEPYDTEIEQHRISTSNDPHPVLTSDNDLSTFRSLIATNTASGNIRLSPASTPDACLFYVTNGSLHRNTPSCVLSFETKEGPVLGTLKLGWGRDNTFGLGDPDKDPGRIKWENLKRTSEWTHATYEFGFGQDVVLVGTQTRKTYVWQRTKQYIFSDQPNMELREKLLTGELGTEVLGVYKGNQGFMWKSRGQFWLSPALSGKGDMVWKARGQEWNELELLALLAGLGVIEASRRRARARRGASNGGGG